MAISGYWAFGNQAKGTILANFMGVDDKSLLPKWSLLMTNIFILLQLLAGTVVRYQHYQFTILVIIFYALLPFILTFS